MKPPAPVVRYSPAHAELTIQLHVPSEASAKKLFLQLGETLQCLSHPGLRNIGSAILGAVDAGPTSSCPPPAPIEAAPSKSRRESVNRSR
jgi:hypothetical protein